MTTLAGSYGTPAATTLSTDVPYNVFEAPVGVAMDAAGTFVLVVRAAASPASAFLVGCAEAAPSSPASEQVDNAASAVRRVSVSSGVVTLVAGQPGVAGYVDGVGTSSKFDGPYGIALASSGSFALVVRTLPLQTGVSCSHRTAFSAQTDAGNDAIRAVTSSSSSATSTPSCSASQPATRSGSPTSSQSRTSSLTRSGTQTQSRSQVATPSTTPTGSGSLTQSPSQASTPTQALSPGYTFSQTPTNSATLSQTPSGTTSGTQSASQAPSASTTRSGTATQSMTGSSTATPSQSGSRSAAASPTMTPSVSATPSLSSTLTASQGFSPTVTATTSPSSAVTPTQSSSPSGVQSAASASQSQTVSFRVAVAVTISQVPSPAASPTSVPPSASEARAQPVGVVAGAAAGAAVLLIVLFTVLVVCLRRKLVALRSDGGPVAGLKSPKAGKADSSEGGAYAVAANRRGLRRSSAAAVAPLPAQHDDASPPSAMPDAANVPGAAVAGVVVPPLWASQDDDEVGLVQSPAACSVDGSTSRSMTGRTLDNAPFLGNGPAQLNLSGSFFPASYDAPAPSQAAMGGAAPVKQRGLRIENQGGSAAASLSPYSAYAASAAAGSGPAFLGMQQQLQQQQQQLLEKRRLQAQQQQQIWAQQQQLSQQFGQQELYQQYPGVPIAEAAPALAPQPPGGVGLLGGRRTSLGIWANRVLTPPGSEAAAAMAPPGHSWNRGGAALPGAGVLGGAIPRRTSMSGPFPAAPPPGLPVLQRRFSLQSNLAAGAGGAGGTLQYAAYMRAIV